MPHVNAPSIIQAEAKEYSNKQARVRVGGNQTRNYEQSKYIKQWENKEKRNENKHLELGNGYTIISRKEWVWAA